MSGLELAAAGLIGFGLGVGLVVGGYVVRMLRRVAEDGEEGGRHADR